MSHFLPHGVAILLIRSLGSYLLISSSDLTPEEERAARIIAYTRALSLGSAAVIVKFSDVVRITGLAA